MNAENLKIGKTTSTIKIKHDNYEIFKTYKEIQSIYALLGGYNEVARHIDIDKFKEIQGRFKDAIADLKEII
jgi:hypothetical protein